MRRMGGRGFPLAGINAGLLKKKSAQPVEPVTQRLALRAKTAQMGSEPDFVLARQEGHWRAAAAIDLAPAITQLGPVQRLPFRQRSAQRPGTSRIIWRPR